MKRVIACLLTIGILLGMCFPVYAKAPTRANTAAEADDAAHVFAQTDYPVIFVTGIGQVRYYFSNPDGTLKTDEDGDLIKYNLLYADKDTLKTPKMILLMARTAVELILSAVIRKDMLSEPNLENILRVLFRANILDENGQIPKDVVYAHWEKPLSRYTAYEKEDFFKFIPCQSLVPIIGEDNIYCFNHSAFGNLYDDAEDLDRFITDVVKPQSGKDKVVLIPMSMGAAVVSAYLSRHETDRNDVKRIVSIVGCWNGSDLLADLIERKYRSDAPEMLYNWIFNTVFERENKPWAGYLINLALRIFPKSVLRGIIDDVLSAIAQTIVLPATSLLALIPHERYLAIESAYLSEDRWTSVREGAHEYYTAQCTLIDRLTRLEEKGVEFFFLCGYGLTFGELTEDYNAAQFMESAVTTNSDEIIPICSTAPGTSFVPRGSKGVFNGAYASPDGTIDLSTSFAPDRTWCFNRQIHQLDYNNTALRLAMEIALGSVTDVHQSEAKYPQFNDSRDLYPLIRGGDSNYLTMLEKYISEKASVPDHAAQVERAISAKERCEAVLESTHNDRPSEDRLLQETKDLLIELGLLNPEDPSYTPNAADKLLKRLNDLVMRLFGAKGFTDGVAIR